ncbi:hypothetical protein HAX54_031282 [Datura stramonium]|uniref:Uncharacterized protein n=1 Tax=Datura stramonium TaxID=4076 RepID=A0ABS8VCH7_DATST|nr:hypothetical protein [Datura stramonium]
MVDIYNGLEETPIFDPFSYLGSSPRKERNSLGEKSGNFKKYFYEEFLREVWKISLIGSDKDFYGDYVIYLHSRDVNGELRGWQREKVKASRVLPNSHWRN